MRLHGRDGSVEAWAEQPIQTAEQCGGVAEGQGRGKPASRSMRESGINGRPTSAVGSWESMASNSVMPNPSLLKLPAQSSG